MEIMMNKEEKYRKIISYLNKWMVNILNDKWIADYLCANQISSVGVYGYGILGRHLVRELQKKGLLVKWVMDKSSLGDDAYQDILRPDNISDIEAVDLVIITPLADMEYVEVFLLERGIKRVISIGELIDTLTIWRRWK